MADSTLRPDEIEALLQQAQAPESPEEPDEQPAAKGDNSAISSSEVESLLNKAEEASATATAEEPPRAEEPARAGDAQPMSQNDIESLFNKPAAAASNSRTPAPPPQVSEETIQADDIELLLQKAEAAIRSIDDPVGDVPAGVRSFKLEYFNGAPPSQEAATIQLLGDVELDLKIELGRTHMYLEEVLKLRKGSVVPLDKLAGDPVDIYVNGRLIARGEVLVLNDNFCVRVAELISAESAVG
jgi:flagellar motor switch protein FliN/FliY